MNDSPRRRGLHKDKDDLSSTSSNNGMTALKKMGSRLPKTYGDLIAKYTIPVKRDKKNGFQNVAIGQFPLSKVPDGKYRIYYFRPKNRNRMLGHK